MTTVSTLTDIRTGRHDHFDRIVLDLTGVPGVTDRKASACSTGHCSPSPPSPAPTAS